MPASLSDRLQRAGAGSTVPAWAARALVVSGAVLATAGAVWLLFWLLLRVPLLTVALVVALLLAALMAPLARRLRRAGAPDAVAALVAVLALLAVLTGIGLLVGLRATARLQELARPLGAAVDRIRVWLIDGPLALDPTQVADLRNQVVTWLYDLAPTPAQGARTGVYALSALILVLFLVFFLLKDGARMWAWVLERVPAGGRERVDGAGRVAWSTVRSYTGGLVLVAFIDAVGIGVALLVLGVPLWVSLTLLTFLGAFVPLFGATVSGAVAVLVTMVTNGLSDAIIVLVVVIVVQQVEGNVLQPLIMGRALDLHPVVILVAVTAGTLLFGLAGALFATPTVAVAYRVTEHLRKTVPAADQEPPAVVDGPTDLPAPAPRPTATVEVRPAPGPAAGDQSPA